MKELTSLNNDLVKFTTSLSQKKIRDKDGLFIVEGEKSLEGAIKADYTVKYIFTTDQNIKILKQAKKSEIYLVNDKIMKKISTTESIPTLLSVIEKKKPLKNKNLSKIILLENIKDCGNLGTIIRSAAAFNFDAIILSGDCCDVYSPKTIRASVGTIFQIDVFEMKNINDLKNNFKDYKIISTDLHKKSDIKINDIKGKFILMFGAEADGLTKEATDISDNNFILPINSSVESLNLATAVSIILYEISKQ